MLSTTTGHAKNPSEGCTRTSRHFYFHFRCQEMHRSGSGKTPTPTDKTWLTEAQGWISVLPSTSHNLSGFPPGYKRLVLSSVQLSPPKSCVFFVSGRRRFFTRTVVLKTMTPYQGALVFETNQQNQDTSLGKKKSEIADELTLDCLKAACKRISDSIENHPFIFSWNVLSSRCRGDLTSTVQPFVLEIWPSETSEISVLLPVLPTMRKKILENWRAAIIEQWPGLRLNLKRGSNSTHSKWKLSLGFTSCYPPMDTYVNTAAIPPSLHLSFFSFSYSQNRFLFIASIFYIWQFIVD